MTVGDLPQYKLAAALRGSGLSLDIGPFVVRIRSTFPRVQHYLANLYRMFPLATAGGAHFDLEVQPPSPLRAVLRPRALFSVNGGKPFNSVPARLATGVLEWGLNWAIGNLAHQWLVVHAAVVARDGRAAILPAPPGSGKSTLCAALAFSGWRLLSDEFAMIDPWSGEVVPVPRPIALKSTSIAIMTTRVPEARFGPLLSDTDGATVRHLAAAASAVTRQRDRARIAWVIVPKWEAGSPLRLEPISKGLMLTHLTDSSFNYNVLGGAGFARLSEIVDGAMCAKLTYSDLDAALQLFDRLASGVDKQSAVPALGRQ